MIIQKLNSRAGDSKSPQNEVKKCQKYNVDMQAEKFKSHACCKDMNKLLRLLVLE